MEKLLSPEDLNIWKPNRGNMNRFYLGKNWPVSSAMKIFPNEESKYIFPPFVFTWHEKYEVCSKTISLDDCYLLLHKVNSLAVGMLSLN